MPSPDADSPADRPPVIAERPPEPAAPPVLPEVERRIVGLLAFRTGLVTLLFAVIVLVALADRAPLSLGTLHAQAMFAALVVAYAATLAFAIGFRRIERKDVAFAALLGLDALLVSAVVHLTGGIQSVWTFLYPLLVVEAAIVGYRRWALWATAGVSGLFLATTLAGYGGLLAPLEGQPLMPDRIAQGELATFLLINLAAQAAIGVLSASLSEQLRRASVQAEQATETLRDMVLLNEQILDSLDSGLVTLDPEGRVLQANPAALSLLGETLRQSSQLALAESLPGLPAPPDVAPAPCRLRTTLAAPGEASPRPVELTITALRDDRGQRTGSILLLTDLTEIAAMEARVQRAERLAAVGRLAAGIAHEIRNPLAAVSGSLELLQSAPEASEDDRRLLGIALREVERLSALVTNLLGFARPRPPQPRAFDLAELAREVLTVAEQDPVFRGVALALRAPEGPMALEADPEQIRQVLWNLLRNAAEAAGKEGRVALALTRERGPDAPGVRLVISDDGPGLDPEARERLFEPFFTTKERGTGLGLATVHRIVEDHHGLVEVTSPPEGGTAVSVRLPGRQNGERTLERASVPVGSGAEGDRTPDL